MKTLHLARRISFLPCIVALAAALAPLAVRAQGTYTPYQITTLAGTFNVLGEADGTGAAARFRATRSVAVDAAGNVYVADTNNNTIRKITFYGVVTTFAGTAGAPGANDGTGAAARFLQPRGLAVDAAGNVYVADSGNHNIRKITPAGVVTTLAGGGVVGNVDGAGPVARFRLPVYLAIDPAGNLFVADNNNNVIRRVTPAGVVTTVRSPGGTPILVGNCLGVAIDAAGNLYASDQGVGSLIRKITPAGVVTVLAGGVEGYVDDVGAAARFRYPAGLAVDPAGNLFVGDYGNVVIRRVTPDGTVTTVAGLRPQGGGTDGIGNVARFTDPQGIATDARGNLYIADANTVRMSVFAPDITPQPVGKIVVPGENYTITSGGSSNVPTTFQWRKDGVAIPGATTATLSTPPNSLPTWSSSLALTNIQQANLGSYTLVATNLAGTTITNAAVIQFTPPPTFASQPTGQNVNPGTNVTFTATATSTLPISYQWQKDGVAISGATTTSLVVNNVQVANLGSYTLVATNAVGPTTSNAAVLGYIPSTAGRLINLSILTSIPAAGETFTMGYVVGGAGATGTKPLVIRAAGPSLGALGVPGTLNDPKIELFAGSTKTGENDNWGGSAATTAAMVAVGAFPYTGPTSLDAASVANISPGDNSVKVSAAGNGTGAVIAEIYDATPAPIFIASTPRLMNVSVLKHLGTSLTVGFVIGGAEAKTVLIRAVGPTLGAAPFGVPGVVADPQLTLFNAASASIGTNNNWGGTPALTAAFTSVGAFALPAASLDAALVATLQPGNYTVEVKGAGTTTGVALVEIYDVP